MDSNRIDGIAKQAKGSIKETIGGAIGNRQMQAEGVGDKAAGRVQNGYGRFLDGVRRLFGRV